MGSVFRIEGVFLSIAALLSPRLHICALVVYLPQELFSLRAQYHNGKCVRVRWIQAVCTDAKTKHCYQQQSDYYAIQTAQLYCLRNMFALLSFVERGLRNSSTLLE